jgi:hypothetical protein
VELLQPPRSVYVSNGAFAQRKKAFGNDIYGFHRQLKSECTSGRKILANAYATYEYKAALCSGGRSVIGWRV